MCWKRYSFDIAVKTHAVATICHVIDMYYSLNGISTSIRTHNSTNHVNVLSVHECVKQETNSEGERTKKQQKKLASERKTKIK